MYACVCALVGFTGANFSLNFISYYFYYIVCIFYVLSHNANIYLCGSYSECSACICILGILKIIVFAKRSFKWHL